eukprot:Rhum_TRINITY_DN14421_c0_g1::Rhum_TRINITY_DN14421_c0_g1_i1::g.88012::m.88012
MLLEVTAEVSLVGRGATRVALAVRRGSRLVVARKVRVVESGGVDSAVPPLVHGVLHHNAVDSDLVVEAARGLAVEVARVDEGAVAGLREGGCFPHGRHEVVSVVVEDGDLACGAVCVGVAKALVVVRLLVAQPVLSARLVREVRHRGGSQDARRLPRIHRAVQHHDGRLDVRVRVRRHVALPLLAGRHGRDAVAVHPVRGVRHLEHVLHLRGVHVHALHVRVVQEEARHRRGLHPRQPRRQRTHTRVHVVRVQVRRESAGAAAAHQQALGVAEPVLLVQRVDDGVHDPVPPAPHVCAVDHDGLRAVSREAVAVAVSDVHPVELAERRVVFAVLAADAVAVNKVAPTQRRSQVRLAAVEAVAFVVAPAATLEVDDPVLRVRTRAVCEKEATGAAVQAHGPARHLVRHQVLVETAKACGEQGCEQEGRFHVLFFD